MQTSCHRCPSALHNRLVTSTPSLSPLSLIHHVRVDASSVTEAPARSRADRRRARNAFPPKTPTTSSNGYDWAKLLTPCGIAPRFARGDAEAAKKHQTRRWLARGTQEIRGFQTDTPPPRPAELSRRVGSAEGLILVAPELYPAKAATRPVIGIIIEFLPTGPHQTARGDAPDTTETQGLAQLRPVDRLHAHRLQLRRVRAPHDPQHDIRPDLRLLDQRQ